MSRFSSRSVFKWCSVLGLAAAGVIASPTGISTASAETIVDVRVAPPVPRVEVVPRPPTPHHVWTPGYWAWSGHRHVWVAGRYVPERHGYVYHPSYWQEGRHGHWHFHQGYWSRH